MVWSSASEGGAFASKIKGVQKILGEVNKEEIEIGDGVYQDSGEGRCILTGIYFDGKLICTVVVQNY